MALKANITEAVLSLRSAKQRSILALIGIVIGIGSVIAMLSVGTIAKHQALEQFRELGTDYLAIHVQGNATGGGSAIRLEDVVELPLGAPSIAGVAPWLRSREAIVYAGKKVVDAPILGVTGSFLGLNRLHLAEGRGISDLDFRTNRCVVGARVASALRLAGAQGQVDEPIRLKDQICHIVGVLESASMVRDPALRAQPCGAHSVLHRATHVPPAGIEPDGRAHAPGRAPHATRPGRCRPTSAAWPRA